MFYTCLAGEAPVLVVNIKPFQYSQLAAGWVFPNADVICEESSLKQMGEAQQINDKEVKCDSYGLFLFGRGSPSIGGKNKTIPVLS